MAAPIVRGQTITLTVLLERGNGAAVDDPDATASIINADGVTVVAAAATTFVSTGLRKYEYAVAVDAPLGAWQIQWDATIDGAPVQTFDGFTVMPVGSLTPGTSPDSAVCQTWATSADVLGTACVDVDPDVLRDCLLVASDILYELTGRRWPGVCVDKVRPQAAWKKADGPPMWWPSTIQFDGLSPWGFCSCNRGRETGCARIPEIRLPHGPVSATGIVVMVDGEPFEDFRLDDRQHLVRTDGSGWPCCQNLLLDDTAVNTWSVQYPWGTGPPIGGRMAAAAYGCQLALGYDPATAAKCVLPAKTQSVTRQGTTVRMIDPKELLEAGLTGFAPVDQWVNSVLVGRKRQPPAMIIPGRHRRYRRTSS